MRLFIALELPAGVRAELAAAQARLMAGDHPLRWADPAGLHLTLQFLGEADGGLVAPLLGALAQLPPAALRLELAGLGGFPDALRPRVVWAGVGGDATGLAALQAAVLAATAPLGFRPEERPFRPHLTLGRARPGAGEVQLRALGAALASAPRPAPLAWEAGRPALFQSSPTPQGPRYTVLGPG